MNRFRLFTDKFKSLLQKSERVRNTKTSKPVIPAPDINVYPLYDEEGGFSVDVPSRDITVRSQSITKVSTLIDASQIIVHPRKHKVIYHASKEQGVGTHKYRYTWDEVV